MALIKGERSRRQSRLLHHSGILIGAGCLFILFLVMLQPFTSINWWLSDQLFVPEPLSPNIVVAGIDDDTLKVYGKWSEWRRSLHAQAINNLSRAGAKVIGFDILFADTSTDDSILAEAISRAGNVVLPTAGTEPLPPTKSEITYSHFLLPTAPLKQASLSLGHANVVPDGDGVVRRLALVVKDASGQTCPAFSLAVLHALFAKPLPQEYLLLNNKLHLLDRDIPVDTLKNMRINFAAGGQSYPTLSYGNVIQGKFDPSLVKHKIVLVGMTAFGELDVWLTPISATKMPGVWVHASAMDAILRQRFLVETGRSITLTVMLLLLAITSLTLPRLKLKWGGVLTGSLFAIYLLTTFVAFDQGYILNILYPSMLLPIVYVANILCVVAAEQSDKRLIKELFGRYVSHQVATEILNLADSGRLELSGEQRTVTALFADIRGFTQMSEQMTPESIVSMLNSYLSAIIERILVNDGMVNKFGGDNVMAVWNAPQPQPQHAQLAVRAAWEAQQAIIERQRKDPTLPRVQFGIGINTGEAIAGSVGSSGRAEYTVIGDAVNLASRICGAAGGGEVWIGGETYHKVKDHVEVEELGPQLFKGKAEPVAVYRVTGLK